MYNRMPLTFAQAYAIVCPDGREVIPQSKEFNDIMELMRQSGYVPFQETLVQDLVPKQATNVAEAKRYHERAVVTTTKYVSRREWLAVDANKEAFLKHLNRTS